MTLPQADALFGALFAVVAMIMVSSTIRLVRAVVDSEPLWEPQWKREARLLARYVPEGDDWGR